MELRSQSKKAGPGESRGSKATAEEAGGKQGDWSLPGVVVVVVVVVVAVLGSAVFAAGVLQGAAKQKQAAEQTRDALHR